MIPQGQLRTKVRFKPCALKSSMRQFGHQQQIRTWEDFWLIQWYILKKTQQDPLDSSDFVFYLWKSPFSCVILWEAG